VSKMVMTGLDSADFDYSQTFGKGFDYYDDYGDDVEKSLRELKE